MNAITDEFLLAQAVAGKIIDRQRRQIDALEADKAQLMGHAQELRERVAVLEALLHKQRETIDAFG